MGEQSGEALAADKQVRAQAAQEQENLKIPRANGPAPPRRATALAAPQQPNLGLPAFLRPAAAARTQTLTRATGNPERLAGRKEEEAARVCQLIGPA